MRILDHIIIRDHRTLLFRFWFIYSGRVGFFIALFILTAVSIGPVIIHSDPNAIDLQSKLLPPSSHHLFGTDQLGRDQFMRILIGGRQSLGAALLVMASVLVIALFLGITAGMLGGFVDIFLMRLVDVLLALPSLIITLAIIGALGVGFQNMLIAIIISSWAYYARLTRSYVVACMHRYDIVADRLAGIGWWRIVTGHILPGVFTQLLIIATLHLGGIIIQIAGLSFLGLGLQPPQAEWGAMLSDSRLYFVKMPWLIAAPSLAIFLSVAASNLIGNALHRATDIKT